MNELRPDAWTSSEFRVVPGGAGLSARGVGKT
jgi:hypothetical protein